MTKILVIEDERLVRHSILDTLENEGFQLIEAADGRAGLTWAREHKPDLIICDIMLPELDGYEVLTSLRQEPATALMPFIFLTAKADKADVRRGMELGADDYLTKPFTPAELLGAIAARLRRQEAIVQYAEQLLAVRRASGADQAKQHTSSDRKPTEYHSIDTLVNELSALKSAQFTGRLLITSASKQEWKFYLHQGRILYATGGAHPVRRWQRHLAAYCPQIQVNQLNLSAELFAREAWEYQIFGLWLKQQQMSREQVAQVIRDSVTEVLFDILQAGQVKYQTQSENPLQFQLLLIEFEQVLAPAQKLWQAWKSANLIDLLPNKAPTIECPELLQQQTSPATYKQLTALLDGKRTLRELALQMKRQASEVTTSLLPYIQSGIVELTDIPDLLVPSNSNAAPAAPATPTPSAQTTAAPASPASAVPTATVKSLIACIDDSPLVCQTMEQIVTRAGYQYVAIQDPLRAISTLITRKPDFIFLDLVMPNLSGYEVCAKLRQMSACRETPIVILSGNAIDQGRAQTVGATDYLEKPVQPETVLQLISKYLSQKVSG